MLINIAGHDGIQPAVGAAEHDGVRQHLRNLLQLPTGRHLVGRMAQQIGTQHTQTA